MAFPQGKWLIEAEAQRRCDNTESGSPGPKMKLKPIKHEGGGEAQMEGEESVHEGCVCI